ncbi:MAG: proprotein convertase P-domain-containing protein [Anaerolineae bacterium]|nr:proprotein convertase P-domain-containing protein [Phycisphaerae bacterium]
MTTPILNTPTNVGGFDFIPMQNGRSVDPECQFAVVPPGRPFAGRVYFMYANEVVNESHNHDIVIRYSDDNGLTWSNEVRVNDDPASPIRSQMLGQIAVDPTTGAVVVSFHDGRNDNGVVPNGSDAVQNNEAQFYGALSTDGGLTWTNFQIDPGWSNEVRAASGIDFGDWTGSDFYGGRFFAIWASNAIGTNGLPNNPAPNNFDLATARVDIIGAGLPGIYGITFDDLNGNAAKDPGEPALAGVTVYIDADNSGTLNAGDTSTTTVLGGSYSFTGLAAGPYVIRSEAPAGQRQTFPASGFYNVNFDGTSAVAGEDFGFVNPRIAGTVFDDSNDNGVFDGSELGLAGVTIYIDADLSGTFNAGDPSTVSAANGTYTLGGLANGSYVVRAVTPAGRRLTFPGSASFSHTVTNAALVFTGDNFGFTNRVRIGGFVYRDANGNGIKDVGETPYIGQRVYQDLNNSGTFDNTGGTFNSANVPLAINDNTTINSTLSVAGGGNINNLTVKLNITHTFDGDLVISLISPIGTTVTLANRRGGTGENFVNTVFDDAAATSIVAGTPPYTGSFRPETPLSALNGQNANGTWTLRVQDAATTDTGSLTGWSITFGSTEPNVLTDAGGAYNFPGLSAGTHNIRAEAPANTVFTNPTNGLRTFNAVGGELFGGDFGLFPTAYSGQDITLRLDPTSTKVQIWIDELLANPPTFTADKTILSTLSFTGTAGTDSLTVDAANGNPLPSLGASYDGLAGTNTLSIKGSTGAEFVVFNAATSAAISGISVNTTNTNVFRFDGRGGNDTLNANANANVFIDNTQHLATLFVATTATATVPAGQNAVIVTNSLSLNGLIDLNDNDMILNYTGGTQLSSIQALINSARNGGLWDGQGLTSTSAKNRVPKNTTLGAIEASDYKLANGPSATFDGEALPGDAVLIKYTYYGDVDFNGTVDFDDYSRVDAGFNNNRTGWFNGDVDGNGIVDFDDYSLIDLAFNTQLGVL